MLPTNWRKLIFSPFLLLLLFSLLFVFFSVVFGNLAIGQFVLRIRYLSILVIFFIFLNFLNYFSISKGITYVEGIKELFPSYSWLILWSFLVFLVFYSVFFGNIMIFGFILRIRYLAGLALVLSVFLNFFPNTLPRQRGGRFSFDSRILIALALLMLVASAFLLVGKLEPLAENAAVLAYGFLVWGVLFQLIEYFAEQKAVEKDGKS